MIDIHTHILPGIDDGAASIEDALDLARAASQEGITALIATPHHANGTYMNPAGGVIRLVDELNERLTESGIPVSVHTGQEIRVHDDLLDAWHRHELLTMAGSKFVLLEMPSSRIPKGMPDLVHELAIMGLLPVIAHPERNAEVVQHPERLEELIDLGAYAQVTTHSLLGGFGKRIEQASWEFLKRGNIHLVSSDAHHALRRGFRMREAYAAIERTMGASWTAYLQANAANVLEDKPFGEQPPMAVSSASKGAVKKLWSALFAR
ncbi:CpsB/CapC family capsule biosynthesis tyrosine phosphatase [Paenibacillus sp. LHD-117]|uniref:tyrosine-protein phosphatase n=1 Tax=Paenibacillus sp. LHD-117 TaxID=3071412 RepID=UPI0027E1D679|nr:CpsB/CapC family capsule biosynthesis tyrosine phosphatase [Paenibacillus sp. LHD-117]MDQ6420690.1 CpsB/CapC family capsule biosynthesis tyrosine phosphatase [Paenibacillus sp. LHD-117]